MNLCTYRSNGSRLGSFWLLQLLLFGAARSILIQAAITEVDFETGKPSTEPGPSPDTNSDDYIVRKNTLCRGEIICDWQAGSLDVAVQRCTNDKKCTAFSLNVDDDQSEFLLLSAVTKNLTDAGTHSYWKPLAVRKVADMTAFQKWRQSGRPRILGKRIIAGICMAGVVFVWRPSVLPWLIATMKNEAEHWTEPGQGNDSLWHLNFLIWTWLIMKEQMKGMDKSEWYKPFHFDKRTYVWYPDSTLDPEYDPYYDPDVNPNLRTDEFFKTEGAA